jgi:hypothetical protein
MPKLFTQIKGVATVLKNLGLRKQEISGGVQRGLIAAALHLQRESQKRVPVEFGVLKNSAFTRATGKGFATVPTVGYTAPHALYVHELVEMRLKGQPRVGGKGRYWDPQGRGQAKFLEEPARTEVPKMRTIILNHAKIK